MEQKESGLLGFLGLIGCVVLYFVLRRFFPSLSAALLWVFGIAALLIVVLVAAVVFFAFHKPKKTPEQERSEAQDAIVKKARASFMELRTATMRVRNRHVRGGAEEICATLEQILSEVKANPEKLPKARSFLQHSLPMLSGILRKYIRLEGSGVPNDAVTEQTLLCLRDLETAAQKQYSNLFASDVVDITAEMEVLVQLCRQNGLLEEELTI